MSYANGYKKLKNIFVFCRFVTILCFMKFVADKFGFSESDYKIWLLIMWIVENVINCGDVSVVLSLCYEHHWRSQDSRIGDAFKFFGPKAKKVHHLRHFLVLFLNLIYPHTPFPPTNTHRFWTYLTAGPDPNGGPHAPQWLCQWWMHKIIIVEINHYLIKNCVCNQLSRISL